MYLHSTNTFIFNHVTRGHDHDFAHDLAVFFVRFMYGNEGGANQKIYLIEIISALRIGGCVYVPVYFRSCQCVICRDGKGFFSEWLL